MTFWLGFVILLWLIGVIRISITTFRKMSIKTKTSLQVVILSILILLWPLTLTIRRFMKPV